MKLKQLAGKSWVFIIGILEFLWGIADRIISDDGLLSFLILPPPYNYILIGMGVGALLIYLFGKVYEWKGENRTWGNIGKQGIKVMWELRVQLIPIILIICITPLIIWYGKQEKQIWIWVHPDSQADASSTKSICQLKAYEVIETSNHPLMTGQTSRERERYVNICMRSYGFTLQRVE